MNLDRSAQMAEQIHAEPLHPFENALRALDHLSSSATYVEGWVVDAKTGELRNHAWCEIDGSIIDPTCCDNHKTYFPGVRYPKLRAKQLQGYARILPLIWYDNEDADHKEYLQALQNARDMVRHFNINGHKKVG
jgi:hypothetical protein